MILALDTTTRAGSVAVMRDDEVLAVQEGDASRTHGERLPGEIDKGLVRAGLELTAIDLLVVATGPGAFTGLRIGLATIQGLALALDKPVIGVSALDALAEAAWTELGVLSETSVAAWMDAQRGEVFSAVYLPTPGSVATTRWRQVEPPSVGTPDVMLRHAEGVASPAMTFVGDGASRYADDIERWRPGYWNAVGRVPALTPALGRLGWRLAAQGEAGPPHALKPLYVRRSDAELDRDRQSRI